MAEKSRYKAEIVPAIMANLNNSTYHDVVVYCSGGESLTCSSLLLNSISPWLGNLMKGFGEDDISFLIPDIPLEVLKHILSSVHNDDQDRNPKNIEYYLQLEGLWWPKDSMKSYFRPTNDDSTNSSSSPPSRCWQPNTVPSGTYSRLKSQKISKKKGPTNINKKVKNKKIRSRKNLVTAFEVHKVPVAQTDIEDKSEGKSDNEPMEDDIKIEHVGVSDTEIDSSASKEKGFKSGQKGAALKQRRCENCAQSFQSQLLYHRHRLVHDIENFSCDCGELPSFKEKADHVKRVHWGWLECDLCKKPIQNETLLKEHRKNHKKNLMRKVRLLNGDTGDSQSKPCKQPVLCQLCGQKFGTSKEEMSKHDWHVRKHQLENYSCQCPNLDWKNLLLKEKERHVSVVHEGYFGCDKCLYSFKTKENLEKHILDVHDKSNVCDICGFVVKGRLLKYSMKEHIRRMHSSANLECPHCGLHLTEIQLRDHVKQVHSGESCKICGVFVKSLSRHMKVVHTSDQDKSHICNICSKGFVGSRCLKSHMMNVHIKSRPYTCRYGCQMAYNDKSNRNQHEKKKHGGLFTAKT